MESPELLVLLENESKVSVKKNNGSRSQRLKSKELRLFSESLSRLLQGGIPVLRAIEGLGNSCKKSALKDFLNQVSESVRQGTGFSSAVENTGAAGDYFPQVIYAGEMSGALPQVLAELSAYLEKEETLKAKIREAVAYPSVILFMGIVTLAVLIEIVIPKLAGVYVGFGAELPLMTRIILSLSNFFMPALFLFAAAAAAVVYLSFKNKASLKRVLCQLPFAGNFFRAGALIQFSRLMALLLESGVAILEALRLIEKTFHSGIFKEDVCGLRENLQEGKSFSQASQDLVWMDPLSRLLVCSGEEAGRLPAAFSQIATDTQARLEAQIQMAVKLLEPGLIVIIGLAVGFIVIGTVLPIFDISGLVQ